MDRATDVITTVVIAYLIGSVPFGLVIAKLFAGVDIRTAGSGNIGATNVARTLGARWGLIVLLLDLLKGLLPVLFLPLLLFQADHSVYQHVKVLCGVTVVVGHMFPCWLKFRGGKGVATSLGVIFVLGWQASLATLVVFAVVFALSRIVSLASILASTTFAVVQLSLLGSAAFSEQNWSLSAFSLLVPLLIIIQHRANIGRLLRGEEKKFHSKDKAEISEQESN